MVLLERIELSSHPYQGRVIPLYYSSIVLFMVPPLRVELRPFPCHGSEQTTTPWRHSTGAATGNRTRFSSLRGKCPNTICRRWPHCWCFREESNFPCGRLSAACLSIRQSEALLVLPAGIEPAISWMKARRPPHLVRGSVNSGASLL